MIKLNVHALALTMAVVCMSSSHAWAYDAACYQLVPTGSDCGVSQLGPLLECYGCVPANCPTFGCSYYGYIIQSTPLRDCQLQLSGLTGFIGCLTDQPVFAVRYNYSCNEVTKCVEYVGWGYVGVSCLSDMETGDRCTAS